MFLSRFFNSPTPSGALPIRHRAYLLSVAVVAFVLAPPVFALQNTDATQDASGGKNLTQIATNIDNTRQMATTVLIGIFALMGIILAGVSILGMYKASKEEREKPAWTIVGVFVGGAMTMIPAIVWAVHNQLVG